MNLSILGSTGSIGQQALDVVASLGEGHRVAALSAGSKWEKLLPQVEKFRPGYAVLADPAAADALRKHLNGSSPTRVLSGEEGLCRIATLPEADIVLSSIVGAAGLRATLAAAEAGKRVAIANKESLVVAGAILMETARRTGAVLLPVDSEHSAVFQALHSGKHAEIEKIVLTASGGPFRTRPRETMTQVTVEEALKHPNWSMGPKITIDSATLMNKALEIIEAKYLFGVEPERIEVLIHPQSIIHSLVQFQDGSVVAQLGLPDMRIPIQYALTYPVRLAGQAPRLELADKSPLTFERPDREKFPALALGERAARSGGTLEAVLNAANEVAVQKFLDRRIPFARIAELVGQAMDRHEPVSRPTLDQALAADRWARAETETLSEGR